MPGELFARGARGAVVDMVYADVGRRDGAGVFFQVQVQVQDNLGYSDVDVDVDGDGDVGIELCFLHQ